MNKTSKATSFINDDFLLQSEMARILYHDYVKNLPIIDYHCHLPPDEIAADRPFQTITQVWLNGDHYKWRAMRTLGVDETFITGAATDFDKFKKWAYTVPYTLRNPLYHWTHLELTRYFGFNDLLNEQNASEAFHHCNQRLAEPSYSTRSLITRMQVEVICTTDDPTDTLAHHQKIKEQPFGCVVLPAFRPDAALAIENPESFRQYLQQLSNAANLRIDTYGDLLDALHNRIDFFHAAGCKLSDHGLEQLYYSYNKQMNPEAIFLKVLRGSMPDREEIVCFKHHTLLALCKMYHAKGWTQQFHLGAMRNNNTRLLATLGSNTGFDSIGSYPQAEALSRFLDELDKTNSLAQTILYNLNPSDNEVMASMIGNFNDGSVKGKIQYGSAWWFLDQKDGMTRQLNALSNLSLLSCFIGMLTDSRSFLSFPRHEYFRRILCNLLGNDVANGELPNDEKWLGKIASDVCYHNAKHYFGF